MGTREAWDALAERWAAAVRDGLDEAYERNARPFRQLLPAPGRLTIDVGCGEGRLARELRAAGHTVVAIDSSPTMIRLARDADPDGDYRLAGADALPVAAGAADLAVAFMSLQDIEPAEAAIAEVARVLDVDGAFCFAILHPVFSSGEFESDADDAPFVIRGSYLAVAPYAIPFSGAPGLQLPGIHRPMQWYFERLEAHGFVVEALREVPSRRQQPVPLFLSVRARKL